MGLRYDDRYHHCLSRSPADTIGWKVRQMQAGSLSLGPSPACNLVAVASTVRDAPLTEEVVRQFIARGEKTEAIKLLRKLRGVGLKEAPDLVEAMSKGATLPIVDSRKQLNCEQAATHPEFRRLFVNPDALQPSGFTKRRRAAG
ncbi:MAG: hypothetical protein H7330_13685 [Hymenobacteraceae bacterium]|nr:hypothetical protein [Hymenobacteraceae bacterium]